MNSLNLDSSLFDKCHFALRILGVFRICFSCVLVCGFLTLPNLTRGGFVDVYSIGNSLTISTTALVLDELTASKADPLRVGFHGKCGANLSSIIADPTFCIASDKFGQYPTALTNNQLNAITVQPFYGSTIRQEVAATQQIVNTLRSNPNNQSTRVLVFAAWPENFSTLTFAETWKSTGANLDSPFVPTEEVYQLFMNELRMTVPEAELIPVGHAYYELGEKISQGLVPGLSSPNDLYDDQIHSSRAGRYLAGLVFTSMLYSETPEGFGYPSIYSTGGGVEFTNPAGRLVAQQTAWEVAQSFITIPEPTSGLLALFASTLLLKPTRNRLKRAR